MGFGQGLSGLNAAAQNLDVIGNNIANSGTVGFKSGSATFADVYANSRVGLGVQVTGVNQRFTVGNVSTSGNMFDMAIDGEKGFFRLTDASGAVFYSRNGQFIADKDNYIVNAQGQRLTGYPPGAVGMDPQPLMVPRGNIAPQATDRMTTVANLDANADVIDPTATPFDSTDPATYTHSLPMSVFDSLGNAHQLTQYFVKIAGVGTSSQWQVHYQLDGESLDTPTNGGPQALSFSQAGSLTTAPNVTLEFNQPGGTESPAEPLVINLNYGGTTSFGGDFSASFTQTGYATGEYAGIAIANDGTLMANYTNGQTRPVGVVTLASFNNPQGLQPSGGNAWTESPSSGQAILGQPGSNGLATLKGQAIEESNVDMSQELVNMIIAQRTYQANAQTIKTQDQILQTLITMR